LSEYGRDQQKLLKEAAAVLGERLAKVSEGSAVEERVGVSEGPTLLVAETQLQSKLTH
jgi:hypothetical protein